jgi:hypothetical protein
MTTSACILTELADFMESDTAGRTSLDAARAMVARFDEPGAIVAALRHGAAALRGTHKGILIRAYTTGRHGVDPAILRATSDQLHDQGTYAYPPVEGGRHRWLPLIPPILIGDGLAMCCEYRPAELVALEEVAR